MPRLTRDQLVESVEEVGLREANARLQRQLAEAKQRTEALVEATITAAYDASLIQGPIASVEPPKADTRDHSPMVALWHLTDWQGFKVTTSYTPEVMRERVERFCDVAHLLTDRSSSPVNECVIAFGGDMVEGLFNYPTQPFEVDSSLFGQFVGVSRLLVDTVRRALSMYQQVTVVPEWGNHGRIGSKRSAVPRADNVDRMCYELARQLLADEGRLSWQDCPEDVQQIEIGRYRALLIHGDEIGRNGYASPSSIVAHVTRWQSGSWPWEFRDCYVGHYHNHSEHALANGLGSVYFTGSTESDNRYARDTMAASAIPSQRLHFIDPDRGRVVSTHKVWLDA